MSKRDDAQKLRQQARELLACIVLESFYRKFLAYLRKDNSGLQLQKQMETMRNYPKYIKSAITSYLTDDLDDKMDLVTRKKKLIYDRNFLARQSTTNRLSA